MVFHLFTPQGTFRVHGVNSVEWLSRLTSILGKYRKKSFKLQNTLTLFYKCIMYRPFTFNFGVTLWGCVDNITVFKNYG